MSRAEEPARSPWGFRIIVTLAALYLLLRLVQVAGWVVDWLG